MSFLFSSGLPYGSYIRPNHDGSGGGGPSGGAGGSVVELNISRSLHHDGEITAKGADANGGNSGGGSGGSIYIISATFSGHGLITVEGGKGLGRGYGGGGGRIAVRVLGRREYAGEYVAYGGYGGTGRQTNSNKGNAAAGTIYYSDNSRGLAYRQVVNTTEGLVYLDSFRKMFLDNDNRNHELPTVISAEAGNVFEFDEVDANNHVVLQMRESNGELVIHKFLGDRTGLLHLKPGQKLNAEYVASTTGYTVAPVSYLIDEGTEIRLPSTVTMLGTRTVVRGLMTGVQNLTIAEGATTVFYSTAQTALIENNAYVHKTKPGNVSITKLTIQRGSVMELSHIQNDLFLTISKLKIKYEGILHMNKGLINSDHGVIESEGLLNVSFAGYTAESGPGAGSTVAGKGHGAAGGGHGGAPKPLTGGTPYNSYNAPKEKGSGGGNGGGIGGAGGGFLHWRNGKVLRIDGLIALNGAPGVGGDAGGGSGGAALLETLNFTGFGLVDGGGGSGTRKGGGGGGGRLAVHIAFANKYAGRLKVVGGLGQPSGAAGTVYIEESNRGPQYDDIKYDKATNKTHATATHRRLELDNEDRDLQNYANHARPWLYSVLNEPDFEKYEFDEAHITRHANLLFGYPTHVQRTTAIIHKFQGDRTGLVHLRDKQKLYVEVVESVSNETVAPCSYLIDAGSEILLPSTVNILGTRTWLGGRITGVQHMIIAGGGDVVFLSTAQTALIENKAYIRITPPGNFTFTTLTVERNSKAEFQKILHPMSITSAEFRVKYQGELFMNEVEINSTYAWIESQGVFHFDGAGFKAEVGPGRGATVNGEGLGAGAGGYGGGPNPMLAGQPGDSVYTPSIRGSGGGNGGGVGGAGGGQLLWNVAKRIEHSGLLSLAGTNGVGGNSGGGSGGAVLIYTTNMTGHGVISVKGGDAQGTGGGGAGGRIGVHCRWRYQYGGKYLNYGGFGTGRNRRSHAGAAGTSYKEENLRELEYRHKKYDKVHNTTFLAVDHTYVHSDNNLIYSPAAAIIMEPNRDQYEFDEMELSGSSRLLIYHPKNSKKVVTTVHRFIGDKTGQLHLRSDQQVYVEYVESESNRTEAPCGYIIDEGAEIILPTEFHVHGTNSTLAGQITGVQHLYIEDKAWIEFHSTAQTAMLEKGTYTDITPKGNFSFDTITVKRGGTAGFAKITKTLSVKSSEFRVKYQGTLYMNDAELYSTYAWIESQGVFHLDGKGHGAETGPAAGKTIGGIGYGAGFGGYGGAQDISQASPAYGSVISPREVGSGGGNGGGVGGSGGGRLLWEISHEIELSGLLGLRGTDGVGGHAGGGSGGSLLLKTTNMTGHGEINILGGNGHGSGCGASGGRVAIHCRWRYTYGGKFTDRGGQGVGNYKLTRGGAAGTIFVENNLRPLEYRLLKYMKTTNDTYFQVDHRYLHVDNEGFNVPVATVIMEGNTKNFEFDELELTGYSLLWVHGQNINMVIHRFIGDHTGLFHLRKKQIIYVEYVESERNVTEAPCSFTIDHGADIVLPTEVHLHGVRTTLNGKLIGIHHMYAEAGASVDIGSTAQTGLIENGTYVEVTKEGNFSVPTVNVRCDGLLQFRRITKFMTVTAALLEVKYKGQMKMNHGFIEAGDMDVEVEGLIDLIGRGHVTGLGPGRATSNTGGGSYGGKAGGISTEVAYGSVFKPKDLGSGGGGGSGGGFLGVKVGRKMHMNGLISVKGAVLSGNYGGGSGGTILIETYNFTGHGTLDASGGAGNQHGCGGSGGRIALHVGYQNNYGGRYANTGGKRGPSSQSPSCDGGPGTNYIYQSRRGPLYREIKYNPRTNRTEIRPEHSELLVDNSNIVTTNPAIVMEENSVYYEFDEIDVNGNSYVHFYHPTTAHNVTVVAHELFGDKTGLIRVQNRQRLVVHYVASTHTYLDAPCGFHVDVGGEVVLPTTVYIRAERVILEGRMSGVEDVYIERGGELILKSEAHTGQVTSGQKWYTDTPTQPYTPGLLNLASLTINNLGTLTIAMNPITPVLDTSSLTDKNGGTVSLNTLKVKFNTMTFDVEPGGKVVGTGQGYRAGPGQGRVIGYGASGGGHGSFGKQTINTSIDFINVFRIF